MIAFPRRPCPKAPTSARSCVRGASGYQSVIVYRRSEISDPSARPSRQNRSFISSRSTNERASISYLHSSAGFLMFPASTVSYGIGITGWLYGGLQSVAPVLRLFSAERGLHNHPDRLVSIDAGMVTRHGPLMPCGIYAVACTQPAFRYKSLSASASGSSVTDEMVMSAPRA